MIASLVLTSVVRVAVPIGPTFAEDPASQSKASGIGIRLESHTDPFDYTGPKTGVIHLPLVEARRHWRLCAIVPHVKDEYWLSVGYGMVEEARRLGVALRISETGGYRSADQQASRIDACREEGADAIVLGSVGYDAPQIAAAIDRAAPKIPVVAAINDVGFRAVAAKVGVSWRDMGLRVGEFLARRHPQGSGRVRAVIATGPKVAGWVGFLSSGIRDGLAGSDVEIVEEGGADTDTQEQLMLVEDLLARHPDVDYLIGSAPAIEAAISVERIRARSGRVRLIATYYTQAIRRGLLRGRVDAAPFDDPRLQGRLAVETAVRAIEGSIERRQIGPEIRLAEPLALPPADALSPPQARPEFVVP